MARLKAYKPSKHNELFDAMDDAFVQMRTGRPGPVFMSLPMDLQSDAADVPKAESHPIDAQQSEPDPAAIQWAAELLMNANRAVIVTGGGVSLSGAEAELLKLGEDRAYATDFISENQALPPDFVMAAKAFGLHAEGVSNPADIGPAITRALESSRPALVEVSVAQDFLNAGSTVVGWWDVPIPDYLTDRRAEYEKNRAEEVPPPTRRSPEGG
jgi:thiamine pyrophosphate-dependent acetolactate synthase large subunit-like protein